MEAYRRLTPGEELVEPYFMIFMRLTMGDPYYGWWLYGKNRELLCTSDQFPTMDECKKNLERVRGAVPNAAVYYAREQGRGRGSKARNGALRMHRIPTTQKVRPDTMDNDQIIAKPRVDERGV